MKFLDLFFEYSGIVLLFISMYLFLKSYNSHKRSMAFRFFSAYLVLTFCVLFTSFVLARYKINNLYWSHFYFVLQFICLSLFYSALFTKAQRALVKITGVVVGITLGIQYARYPEMFYKFNTPEIFLSSCPLVVYAIIHLYNALNRPGKFMYINSGVLMYIATSTLIFILGDYLSGFDNKIVKNIWFLNKVLYVGYLILIIVEWKKNLQPIRSK